MGSWNREDLINFLDSTEKSPGSEIIHVKQRKINNFAILNMQPNLTKKQKFAMDIAIRNNYYDYPRKVNIEALAKKAGISYSTFHAHLRKAEQKLLPFYFRKYF